MATLKPLPPSSESLDPERVIESETDVGSIWLERDAELMTPSILELGRWADELTALMRVALRPGMTFVDVGANIGYFSVLGSKLVGPEGRVLCVEADPANVAILRANLWKNNCQNAQVLPVAAWESETELSLVPNQAGGAGTAVDPGWEPDRAERIPAFRLDQMIDGRVDYVKVDCEGTDDRVVTGAEGLIRANPSLLLTVEHMAIHASRSIPAYRDLGLKPYEIRAFGRLRSTTYEAVAARGEKDVTQLFDFALAINEQRHLTSKSAAALRWMRRGANGVRRKARARPATK